MAVKATVTAAFLLVACWILLATWASWSSVDAGPEAERARLFRELQGSWQGPAGRHDVPPKVVVCATLLAVSRLGAGPGLMATPLRLLQLETDPGLLEELSAPSALTVKASRAVEAAAERALSPTLCEGHTGCDSRRGAVDADLVVAVSLVRKMLLQGQTRRYFMGRVQAEFDRIDQEVRGAPGSWFWDGGVDIQEAKMRVVKDECDGLWKVYGWVDAGRPA